MEVLLLIAELTANDEGSELRPNQAFLRRLPIRSFRNIEDHYRDDNFAVRV